MRKGISLFNFQDYQLISKELIFTGNNFCEWSIDMFLTGHT